MAVVARCRFELKGAIGEGIPRDERREIRAAIDTFIVIVVLVEVAHGQSDLKAVRWDTLMALGSSKGSRF